MKNIRPIKHVKLNGGFICCEKQCDCCHIYHSTQLNAYAIANTHGQLSCLYLMPFVHLCFIGLLVGVRAR